MIKAVIYDLDDVIVNSHPLHTKAWNILFSEYGKKISDLDLTMRSGFMGMRISDILKIIIKQFNLTADYQNLYKKRQAIFLDLVRSDLTLMPGLIESLDFFQKNKIKIALGSSGAKDYINLVLAKFNLHNYFTVIITGDDVKLAKPDPEIYSKTVEKLNLSPNDCVVLEDAQAGVKAAKAAGCKCLAVKNPYTTPPQNLDQANLIVNSLLEINLNILNSL
ncbi:MAG: HAD family phosphatase [Candidatus Buchananbacteria bacterium]